MIVNGLSVMRMISRCDCPAAAACALPDAAVLAASLAGLAAGFIALRRIVRRPGFQLQPVLLAPGVRTLDQENHI